MALPDDLAATLATVDLFAGLPTKVLGQLATYGRPQSFAAGEPVIVEGAPVTGWAPFSRTGALFHVVLDGSGEVRRHGAVIGRVGPGDYTGELSIIDGGPRTAEVVAGPDGLSSLAFDKWTFAELLEEHPEVAVPMLRVTIARLRRCQDELHGEE